MSIGGRLMQLVDGMTRSNAREDVNRRHRPDYRIALYMGLLMLIGLIIIYSIGPQRANVLNNAYGSNYSDTYFFVKQAVSLLLALAAFGLAAIVPYTFFTKNGSKLLIAGLAACALLAVAGWAHLGIAQASPGRRSMV